MGRVIVAENAYTALSCQVSSSNPAASIVWMVGSEVVTGTDSITDGEYNGNIVNSTFNYKGNRADRNITCHTLWMNNANVNLTRSVLLNVTCKY